MTYIVRDGWAMRYKMLSDGRRQILNFILPGDFIGVYGSLIDTADHSVETLTRVQTFGFIAAAHRRRVRQLPAARRRDRVERRPGGSDPGRAGRAHRPALGL